MLTASICDQVRHPQGPCAHPRTRRGTGHRPHRSRTQLGLGALHQPRQLRLSAGRRTRQTRCDVLSAPRLSRSPAARRWGCTAASPCREAELTDPWVALEPGDRSRRAGAASCAAHTRRSPPRARCRGRYAPWSADSWRRSARARVSPDGAAQVELSDGDLGPYRAEHPLARVMPLFRELMGTFAADGEHLLAVCDAHGRLLWVEGHRTTRRRAGRMNFVPGARWSETAVGTNAPGTAVAVDRPVQVFAAEHFIRRVQPWTCAAAPVHDPRTGRVLGAVDITGGDGLAHPHSLAFVQAVARAAESQLALLAPPPAHGRHASSSPRSAGTRRCSSRAAARSGSAAGTARSWCCWPATRRA